MVDVQHSQGGIKMNKVIPAFLLGLLALLLFPNPALANEEHFPLEINRLEMSREGFHALLRQNSGRLAIIKIHFRHAGLAYTPSHQNLKLTSDTTKDELTLMAIRALELRTILEAYFHPRVGQVKLEGQALIDRLEAYAHPRPLTTTPVEVPEEEPALDSRFPLAIEGLKISKIQYHGLLAQNSWWLHYESDFVQDDTFNPSFTDLGLRLDTPADELAALAGRGLKLRGIILRFKEHRATLPVERLREALIAYQDNNENELQTFFEEFPLSKEALSLFMSF